MGSLNAASREYRKKVDGNEREERKSVEPNFKKTSKKKCEDEEERRKWKEYGMSVGRVWEDEEKTREKVRGVRVGRGDNERKKNQKRRIVKSRGKERV